MYLDMNGIIHPCCHPEDGPAPEDEEHMYENIFLYLDRLIRIVRPKKLMYMAIDGVAPRAKMNQQRSRRFRSAQERTAGAWDSNQITPGTPFMSALAQRVQAHMRGRVANHAHYRDLKVLFSPASTPG